MAPKGYKSVNLREKDFKKLGHYALEKGKPKIDMLEEMIEYFLAHHPIEKE